ncbi:hypothetical protein [Vallitalea okinawensis]|uniref:hypothetical protein n=1 Tax=Vallitalea okinawensis TaxID=2078660 RepID=UPI000CFC6EA8|nr:hypothetical protein [Vallitalea okinawensis]
MNKISLVALLFLLVCAMSGCSSEALEPINKIEVEQSEIEQTEMIKKVEEKDAEQIEKEPAESNTAKEDKVTSKKEESIDSGDVFYNPIVYNGILLGGYSEGSWYEASEIYQEIQGGNKYKIYGLNGYIGEGVGKKPILQKDEAWEPVKIYIKCKEELTNDDYIALNSNYNAMPRIPIMQSNESKTYKEIVKEILMNNGMDESIPINIIQNIKIDLEGDGVDEVIVMAENVSSSAGYQLNNTYSILFVRKIIDNEVKTMFIAKDIVATDEDYVESIAMTYEIKSIVDVDADGIMELLVKFTYYEGYGYRLYKFENEEMNSVGCYSEGV